MTNAAEKTNWFEELLNEVVPAVPACSQLFPQPAEENNINKTLINQCIEKSVPFVPTVPAQKYNSEKICSITPKQESTVRTWLHQIGEPFEDHPLVLNKCRADPEVLAFYLDRANESKREERRAKVLAILAENPKTQRAIITDSDSDPGNAILTIAIRDLCTFEMAIPKGKFDSFAFLELINKGLVQ